MHGDNCKSVYCHWDGYLEHNGVILQEHYDSARANQLVAHGDISSLAPRIVALNPLDHCFEKPEEGTTVFYGRDRKETGADWHSDADFEAFFARAEGCFAEWYYIMRDGVWYVGNTYERDTKYYKKLVLLSTALADAMEVSKTWDTVDL
jgi:hypothetical protein